MNRHNSVAWALMHACISMLVSRWASLGDGRIGVHHSGPADAFRFVPTNAWHPLALHPRRRGRNICTNLK